MHSFTFLFSVIFIFLTPYLLWKILKNDNFFPYVIIQIITGVILGPTIFGAISPDLYKFVFNSSNLNYFDAISTVSIIIFAMLSGFEINLSNVLENKYDRILTSFLLFFTPFLFGTLIIYFLFSDNIVYLNYFDSRWQFSMAMGLTCAITALPVLIIFLEKLNILYTNLGQRLIQYASLDDIIMWTIFAVIMLDKNTILNQFIFLFSYPFISLFLNKYMKFIPIHERLFVLSTWTFLSSFYSDVMGFHYIVGAFLSGLSLNKSLFDQAEVKIFRKFVFIFLLPFFFLSTGIKTIWTLGNIKYILLFGGVLFFISFSAKFLGCFFSAKILNWRKNEYIPISLFLQTKGLITIIFANVLLEKNIISNITFSSIIFMSIISTIITIPFIQFLKYKKFDSFVK